MSGRMCSVTTFSETCPGSESEIFREMSKPRAVCEASSGMSKVSVEVCGSSGSGRAEALSVTAEASSAEGRRAVVPGGSVSSMTVGMPVSVNPGCCRGSSSGPT